MVRKYDALFILPATLKEDELDATLKRVEDMIVKLDGSTSNVDILGKRSFARPTKKLDAGYYVKLRFDLDASRINVLRSRLKLDDGVFRAQILRGTEVAPLDHDETQTGAAADQEGDNG